jgi:hypothetical protein
VPSIQFTSPSSSGVENQDANLEVILSSPVAGDLTINYGFTDGSATAPDDYNNLIISSVIPSGNTTANINVPITPDGDDEPDEDFTVTLEIGVGYVVGVSNTHTYTITDDDIPAVNFSSGSSSGDESQPANLALTISPPPWQDITVVYSFTAGIPPATAPTDYEDSLISVSVTAGGAGANIPITINDDGDDEPDELFIVTITAGTGYTPGGLNTHTYTINDNDDPEVNFVLGSSSGDESQSANLALTINPAPWQDITVGYSFTAGTPAATPLVDYDNSVLPVTVLAGNTAANINVTIIEENDTETDEQFIITLQSGGGYIVGTTINSHTYTIINDDFITILSAITMDTDGNGKIDHYKITFSESVKDDSFPGYLGADIEGTNTDIWEVGDNTIYNNERIAHGLAAPEVDGLNDGVIYLRFDEETGFDTGAKPELTTSANPGLTNSIGIEVAQVDTPGADETDGAPPVIASASGKVGFEELNVLFSEVVDGTSGDAGCFGIIDTADFTYNNNNGMDAGLIAGINDSNACDDRKVVLLMSPPPGIGPSDFNSDTIQANSDAPPEIFDAVDLPVDDSIFKTVTGFVAPYVLSVATPTNTTVRVTFSEAMDSSGGAAFGYPEYDESYCINQEAVPPPNIMLCPLQTIDVISVTEITDSVFDLNLATSTTTGENYTLWVEPTLIDSNEGASLADPKYGTFVGSENPWVVSAQAISTTEIEVTFSKDMSNVSTCYSVENVNNYKVFCPGWSIGPITSAVRQIDQSKVILTHVSPQQKGFCTITIHNDVNGVNTVDSPLCDNTGVTDTSVNPLQEIPKDRTPFVAAGGDILNLSDGPIYVDPFGDNTSFNFTFTYRDRVYLGPDDTNSAAFRFEADGLNASAVSFLTEGGIVCDPAYTFGYDPADMCGINQGPNGERGIAGFFSGKVIFGSDFDILMVGPIKNGLTHTYFTQDTDSQLNWNSCDYTGAGGSNAKSIQTAIAFGDSYYIGIAGSQIVNGPYLSKQQLIDVGADGILDCSAFTDLDARNIIGIGKGGAGNNPCKTNNSSCVAGIDSMLFIESGGLPTPDNTFYVANNGGLVYTNIIPPFDSLDFSSVFLQADLGGVTLVLPDNPVGLEKLPPGQQGVPFLVVYQDILYMARNLAVDQSAAGQVTNYGAELWKCSQNCTCGIFEDGIGCPPNPSGEGWLKVADSTNFTFFNDTCEFWDGDQFNCETTTGCFYNNLLASCEGWSAISMLQVNGPNLYLGFDNSVDGVGVFQATSEIDPSNSGTGEADFTQVDVAGFGMGPSYSYIFSSASLEKQGYFNMYLTIGDGASAVEVLRRVD